MRMPFPILPLLLCIGLGAFPALAQEELSREELYVQELGPDYAVTAPGWEPSYELPPAAAPEQETPPPVSTPSYGSGLRMGTSSCDGVRFECDKSNAIAIANKCIRTSFGTEQAIMAGWGGGEFENCIMPGGTATNAQGTREWAVCCVQRQVKARPPTPLTSEDAALYEGIPVEPDQCFMACTRYIDQSN